MGLRELDVLEVLARELVEASLLFGGGKDVAVAVPPIELDARTAASPRRSMSASVASTTSRTLRSASAFASVVAPRLR